MAPAASQVSQGQGQSTRTDPRAWRWPVGLGVGLALCTIALRLRDPHQSGSWGWCPLRTITGWDCPMCGGLRATNDLTHGRVHDAWFSNAFFVASIPLLVAGYAWWLIAALTGRRLPTQYRWVMIGLGCYTAALIAFGIWRNTPWGAAYWA